MAKLLPVNGWEHRWKDSDSNVELNDTRSNWRTEAANQKGGSEWEPIKNLFKNSAYEPDSLVHLHKLLLPSPRNHWSATGPRRRP
jgi:hypothetical protein